MDDQVVVQARLKEIMRMGEVGQAELQELLHRQHYDFAHKLVQFLVEEHFHDLIASFADGSAQDWISRIWMSDAGNNSLLNYSLAIQPRCQLVKLSDELGVIHFMMPAPRTSGETLYSAVIFLIDEEHPSTWLRRYFTLELGSYFVPVSSPLLTVKMETEDSPVHWIFAEWANFTHTNYGEFELEPTLNNFLAAVVDKVRDDWFLD